MKNLNKKVPNQVKSVVFSNPSHESVKPKTVVREL
jgi:hypothetical protein